MKGQGRDASRQSGVQEGLAELLLLGKKKKKERNETEAAHIASGGATARPPRAAGQAHHQRLKENFLYIKVEPCNFLAKYVCTIRIVWAPKSF
jgi:hypothetical protein